MLESLISSLNLMPDLLRLNVRFSGPFNHSTSDLGTFKQSQLDNGPRLETLEIKAYELYELHNLLII